MRTAIGERLSPSCGGLVTASAIAALVVAADLTLVRRGRYPISMEGRGVLAIIAMAANVWLVQGHSRVGPTRAGFCPVGLFRRLWGRETPAPASLGTFDHSRDIILARNSCRSTLRGDKMLP
jgi:hypothetical protein